MTYITITPSKVKNRFYVARKGVGHDNYYMIAECSSQDYAERIARAMNAEQPQTKLDVVNSKVAKMAIHAKRKA